MLERNIFNNFNFNNDPTLLTNDNKLNEVKLGSAAPLSLCAELSLSIYNTGYHVPYGWNLLHSYEDGTGYKGAFYTRNLLTTNAQVIIVHRGTVFNFANLLGDFQIALGQVPIQFDSVNKFIREATIKLAKIYGPDEKGENNRFDMMNYIQSTSTGHSLGAILADYCGMSALFTITFENPGSKPSIHAYLIKVIAEKGYDASMIPLLLNQLKNKCQAYQAGVNIINTCNEQVGRTFRIGNLEYAPCTDHLMDIFPPSSSYKSNPSYIEYSLDQHSMQKIKDYIAKGYPTFEISNPIGFQAGYIEYLNPSNKAYWDEYLKKIWNDPSLFGKGLRIKYNNNLDAFFSDSYDKLTQVYNEARNQKSLNLKMNLFKPAPKDTDQIIEEFTLVEKPNPSRCSIM